MNTSPDPALGTFPLLAVLFTSPVRWVGRALEPPLLCEAAGGMPSFATALDDESGAADTACDCSPAHNAHCFWTSCRKRPCSTSAVTRLPARTLAMEPFPLP